MEKIIIGALRVANWLYYNTTATLTIIMSILAIALIANAIQRRMAHE